MQSWPDLVSSGEARYARHVVYVKPEYLIGERDPPYAMPCHEVMHNLHPAGRTQIWTSLIGCIRLMSQGL